MTYVPEKPDKKYKFDPNRHKHGILYKDWKSRKFMEGADEEEDANRLKKQEDLRLFKKKIARSS